MKCLLSVRDGLNICNTGDRRIVASRTLYMQTKSIAMFFQFGMLRLRCLVKTLHFVQTGLHHAALLFEFLEMKFETIRFENFRLGGYFQFGLRHVTEFIFFLWNRIRCTFRWRFDRDASYGTVRWNAKYSVLYLVRRLKIGARVIA